MKATEGILTDNKKKPARSPKTRLKKRNRSTRRVSGHKNALYQIAHEYKSHHPKATALAAWRHFAAVASVGAHDVLLGFDSAADALEYRPHPEKFQTRQIHRRSFEQAYYRLGNIFP